MYISNPQATTTDITVTKGITFEKSENFFILLATNTVVIATGKQNSASVRPNPINIARRKERGTQDAIAAFSPINIAKKTLAIAIGMTYTEMPLRTTRLAEDSSSR